MNNSIIRSNKVRRARLMNGETLTNKDGRIAISDDGLWISQKNTKYNMRQVFTIEYENPIVVENVI